MPNPTTNAEACKRSRLAAGHSQRSAAAHLPCTAANLSAIEAGKYNAGPAVLKAMADLYGVPIEKLYVLSEDAA